MDFKKTFTCLVYLSMLDASTYDVVTGSDNTASPETGSYRSAIQMAQQNGSSNEIQITESGSPVFLEGDMGDATTPSTTLTNSLTIKSNSSGFSRTVNGNGYTALSVGQNGKVTLSSDIIYENSNVSIGGSKAAFLTLNSPQNYSSLSSNNTIFFVGTNNKLTFSSGNGTLLAQISLVGVETLSIEGSVDATGTIFGSGFLSKQGIGTLTVSNSNSYSGGTELIGGQIIVAHNRGCGTGDIGIYPNTIFTINDGISISNSVGLHDSNVINVPSGIGIIEGVISYYGSLTKIGDGTLVLTKSNTYNGDTTISEGTIVLSGSGSIPQSNVILNTGTLDISGMSNTGLGIKDLTGSEGSFIILGSKNFNFGTSTSTTIASIISGSGTVGKEGTGTATFSGVNTYSGGTNIASGKIVATNSSSLGTGLITISNSVLEMTSGITLQNLIAMKGTSTIEVSSGSASVSGSMSSSGSLIKTGEGTLVLTNANTYQGTTTVSGGGIMARDLGSLPSTTSVQLSSSFLDISEITASGMTIKNLGSDEDSSIHLGDKALTITAGSSIISGVISGASGTLIKQGTGTTTLAGINTYLQTEISLGIIALTGSLPSSATVNLAGSGAIFDLSGITASTLTIGRLSGGAGSSTLLGSKTLIVQEGSSSIMSGTISGFGGISKQGSGAWTLSGMNTYEGGINVVEGQIIANNNMACGTGPIYLNDMAILGIGSGITLPNSITLYGSATMNVDFGTATLSGVVTGQSRLSKTGAGTLVFTNVNNLIELDVELGTLSFAGNGSLSSSAIVNLGGAGAVFDLSGMSASTLTLRALTGESGSLVSLGSKGLIVGDASSSIMAGSIFGTGSFTKKGSGSFTFLSSNSYSGGTYIEEGTVLASTSDIFGVEAVTWKTGTSFVYGEGSLERSDSLVFFGLNESGTFFNDQIIKGLWKVDTASEALIAMKGNIQAEGISKVGRGTLELTGNNLIYGAISLEEGLIKIGSNQAFGTTSIVAKEGTGIAFETALFENRVNLEGDVSFSVEEGNTTEMRGKIFGDNSSVFTKNGSGKMILEGDILQVGTSLVNKGQIVVAGHSVANWIVAKDAILTFCPSGTNTGSISSSGKLLGNLNSYGSVVVESDGLISSGCSVGQMNIYGNMTMEPSSSIYVEVGNTGHDRYIISGTYTIGDQVDLYLNVSRNYNRLQNSFVFLDAGQIIATQGGFANVIVDNPFLIADVEILGDEIGVDLYVKRFNKILKQNNAARVGEAIDQVILSGNDRLDPIVSSLIVLRDIDAIGAALNQMQPAMYKALTISQENNNVSIQESVLYRIQSRMNMERCNPDSRSVNVWLDGFGNALHQKSNIYANSPQFGYQSNTAGVVLGVDTSFLSYFYAGAFGGYTDTDVKYVNHQGTGGVNTGYGGVYFSGISDMFYGNLSVMGGFSGYHGDRVVRYTGVDVTATNTHQGSELLTHLDTGVNLGKKGFIVRPYDSLNYVWLAEDSYTESGANLYNLNVSKNHSNFLRNELGIQFVGTVCGKQSVWSVSPKLSWVREIRTNGSSFIAKFVGTEALFEAIGYVPDRSLLSTGILVSGSIWQDRFVVDLYYNGEFGTLYSNHSYGGQLRFGF